jgi:predicted enzyme related to lactoylglutathione lyase
MRDDHHRQSGFSWALLYVADPLKSADLYEKILGVPATDRAATFSMFALANGFNIGLWLKNDVLPAANAPGGVELSFTEASREAVQARAQIFRGLGVTILQEPTAMDFGFTFTAADPDGHRIRVFAPGQN